MVVFHGVDALKCVETIQMHMKLWMNNHNFQVMSVMIVDHTDCNQLLY